jgi:hypothetical protein
MDLSTYHQINGLLDPSLILIEKLTRVMLIAGSVFRFTARLPCRPRRGLCCEH